MRLSIPLSVSHIILCSKADTPLKKFRTGIINDNFCVWMIIAQKGHQRAYNNLELQSLFFRQYHNIKPPLFKRTEHPWTRVDGSQKRIGEIRQVHGWSLCLNCYDLESHPIHDKTILQQHLFVNNYFTVANKP